MFRLQSLFHDCPARSRLRYELRIPLDRVDKPLVMQITTPDGHQVESPVADAEVTLERTDGAGVHIFDAQLCDARERNVVYASNQIHVTLLEEPSKKVREAVDEAIKSVKADFMARGFTANPSAAEQAQELHRSLKGAEVPECARRVVFNLGSRTEVWRNILVLRDGAKRGGYRNHAQLLAEVACEVLCTSDVQPVLAGALAILKDVPLKPVDKWVYFMRLLLEVGPTATAMNRQLGAIAVEGLAATTVPALRPVTLHAAERICTEEPGKARFASVLFERWKHREGAAKLLTALEMHPELAEVYCNAFEANDYREAIPALRQALALTSVSGASRIVRLLSSWHDVGSVPAILARLDTESQPFLAATLTKELKELGDADTQQAMHRIATRSPSRKKELMLRELSV